MWILRRKGGKTAKELARILNCRTTKEYIPRKRHFIINYGRDYENANLNRNVIFNKLKVYELLLDAGISEPKLYHKGDNIPDEAFPLLARKCYHSQGRDIIYIHNREQLEELDESSYNFLTEYIAKTAEYRVHILGDEAFVSVKFCGNNNNADPLVRSHSNGWRQIEYDRQWKDDLIDLAKKAIKTLNYDFGAVDIIRKGNNLYVLEVNTAPGLEPRKLQIYSEYFRIEEQKWRENNNYRSGTSRFWI